MNDVIHLKTKPHYEILDGLRGVAAVMVVCFHLFEAHASSHFNQIINHGYLAVDFFFVLSGFVIGYAYDDRWKKMTIKDFIKRRLIRLQPMIIMGGLIGALFFYWGTGSNIEGTSAGMLIVCTIASCLLLPVPVSMDIRGWTEMYPLNGPEWSLFFEYIANLLYALIIRRFSNKVLFIFVLLFGCITVHFLFTNANGDMIGGWSLTGEQLRVGFTRLLYPFFAGLLLSRLKLKLHVSHPFFFCSLLVIVLLAFPRLGGESALWMNALYESICILILFPFIVVLGSSSKVTDKQDTSQLCLFLGKISYPLYLVHYPLVYMYFKYVQSGGATVTGCWIWGITIVLVSIGIAYLCERFYDVPVRNWLKKKYL